MNLVASYPLCEQGKSLSCTFYDVFVYSNRACDPREESTVEEEECDMEIDGENNVEGLDTESCVGVKTVSHPEDCEAVAASPMCLAFVEQITLLASLNITNCTVDGCKTPAEVRLKEEYVGSALYIKWVKLLIYML